MKTIIRKASNAVVTGTCAGLGVLHFVAQTTADVVSEAEAQLLQRRDGSQIEDIKKERMYKTIERQRHILNKVEAFKRTVVEAKNRIRGVKSPANGEYLPMVLVSAENVV